MIRDQLGRIERSIWAGPISLAHLGWLLGDFLYYDALMDHAEAVCY